MLAGAGEDHLTPAFAKRCFWTKIYCSFRALESCCTCDNDTKFVHCVKADD